jgi:hypothetical protein
VVHCGAVPAKNMGTFQENSKSTGVSRRLH